MTTSTNISGNHSTSSPIDPREIYDWLLGFDLWKGAAREEGVRYLNGALNRLLVTLDLVPITPPACGARLLELGSNPYFLTLLLRRFRPAYEVSLGNWFSSDWDPSNDTQTIENHQRNERHSFTFKHFNAETEPFPYPNGCFSTVLCCEILEHLTHDPAHMLAEIRRVLSPGGLLVLTTPNVNRLGNITALLQGRNIHDTYSNHGPYGRHNREYTPWEARELVEGCGFAVRSLFLEDLFQHRFFSRLARHLMPRWRDNIYLLAEARGVSREYRPAALYRSPSGSGI